ncbi:hypothetical protein FRC03_000935 [Tulasnella sp. 419]|nr:hypothetical protein FRC03_000935 [Tulasnella sp. 419]
MTIPYPIEKFNGINYPKWAHEVEAVLRYEGLWATTQNNDPRPSALALGEGATKYDLYQAWRVRQERALGIIKLYIEHTLSSCHISENATAAEAWTTLASFHDKNLDIWDDDDRGYY